MKGSILKEYLHLLKWHEWIVIILFLPIVVLFQLFTKITNLFDEPKPKKEKRIIKDVSEKFSTYLYPKKSKPLSFNKSKFGGPANSGALSKWPNCKICDKPLIFTLQLFKKDFPEFYFPEGKDLFQLFGCFNDDCTGHFKNEDLNSLFYCYYGNETKNSLKGKSGNSCSLHPKKISELPHESSDIYALCRFEDPQMKEKLRNKGERMPLTKIPGYSDWLHAEMSSKCECGNPREVFFQLSSEEYEQHGIMIGDVGTLHLYVCEKCGEKSIRRICSCY